MRCYWTRRIQIVLVSVQCFSVSNDVPNKMKSMPLPYLLEVTFLLCTSYSWFSVCLSYLKNIICRISSNRRRACVYSRHASIWGPASVFRTLWLFAFCWAYSTKHLAKFRAKPLLVHRTVNSLEFNRVNVIVSQPFSVLHIQTTNTTEKIMLPFVLAASWRFVFTLNRCSNFNSRQGLYFSALQSLSSFIWEVFHSRSGFYLMKYEVREILLCSRK